MPLLASLLQSALGVSKDSTPVSPVSTSAALQEAASTEPTSDARKPLTQPQPQPRSQRYTQTHTHAGLPPVQTLTLPPQSSPLSQSQTQNLSPLQRQIKQLGLFFAGAGFMAASVAITRRSIIRRQRESFPRFFHASNRPASEVELPDRQLLAVQAFGLATLNVTSFGILLFGGLSWAFDLCSVAELRERTQLALQRQSGDGLLNEQDEKEMEMLMQSLMQRLGMAEGDKPPEGTEVVEDALKK